MAWETAPLGSLLPRIHIDDPQIQVWQDSRVPREFKLNSALVRIDMVASTVLGKGRTKERERLARFCLLLLHCSFIPIVFLAGLAPTLFLFSARPY
ncbi:hypothetical protein P170DRAFT_33352 [Aspergillus steynii IBT 23096]|uniref:Uncharacterized protein n=1 Tax=Aspergillus steynii IBT 23096 TaxID=1392250 RepID=A0A2I2GQJ5_9EURO|nr:uncharacterized protein P170DRAFT_33352 [Aspergillus steynii IBT 23096]PLB55145.1 hypothetical protein P170DRAFT_33352 [Aspergillus steynii IBT 23096]